MSVAAINPEQPCENRDGPGGATNANPDLTHSSGTSREGLGVKPTQDHSLDADHTRVLVKLADLQVAIADLTSEAESLKAELRALPAGDYLVDGRPALRIIPTRRFDATAAAMRLPEDVRSACLQVAYDAAKVKQHLTPVEVDEFMVEAGKPKVTIL